MINVLTKKLDDKKKKKGFTLIELIIVIAIIAILVAIAVPKFMNVTEDAKIKADLANAKTIESAITTGLATGKVALPTSGLSTVDLTTVLNTVPNGKYTPGTFEATVDLNGNIEVKIVEKNADGTIKNTAIVIGATPAAKYKEK